VPLIVSLINCLYDRLGNNKIPPAEECLEGVMSYLDESSNNKIQKKRFKVNRFTPPKGYTFEEKVTDLLRSSESLAKACPEA
jgi:hypothetical protein